MHNISTRELPLDFGLYPALGHAHEIWTAACRDWSLPCLKDIDLVALPADLIPNSIVFDVLRDEDDYEFRFFGTGAVTLYKEECTGRSLTNLGWSTEIVKATKWQLDAVVASRTPKMYQSTYRNNLGLSATKTNLRMPVVGEAGNDEVAHVLSCFVLDAQSMDQDEQFGSFKNSLLETDAPVDPET